MGSADLIHWNVCPYLRILVRSRASILALCSVVTALICSMHKNTNFLTQEPGYD